VSDQQRNLECWGLAVKSGRQVDFVVKVRYAKIIDDGRYEASGAKGKAESSQPIDGGAGMPVMGH
jgi:hypothetical protein